MKNNIVRIVAVMLAMCMMVTVYGCKKSGDANESNGGIAQPTVENGTAVVTYTSVNSEGKEEDVTTVITSVEAKNFNYLTSGTTLNQELKDEEDKKEFVDSANDKYSISSDKAQEIVNNVEKWNTFYYIVYISNTNAKAMTYRSLNAQSTDSIIIQTDFGCVFGLDSGHATGVPVYGIYDSSKYSDEESLLADLSQMSISIKCAYVDGSFVKGTAPDIDDWSSVELVDCPIKISSEVK